MVETRPNGACGVVDVDSSGATLLVTERNQTLFGIELNFLVVIVISYVTDLF